jgi:hypothetical protein
VFHWCIPCLSAAIESHFSDEQQSGPDFLPRFFLIRSLLT